MKHIKIRRHLRFAKCTTCSNLRKQRRATNDGKKIKAILKEIRAHYQFVKDERGGYYDRRQRARKEKNDYMSIIIDGADWYGHRLMHFCEKTHENMAYLSLFLTLQR